MGDFAEYVGDIPGLKGERAMVAPYGDDSLPLEERWLQAKFENPIILTTPNKDGTSTVARLDQGWFTFPVTDFKLLVRVLGGVRV